MRDTGVQTSLLITLGVCTLVGCAWLSSAMGQPAQTPCSWGRALDLDELGDDFAGRFFTALGGHDHDVIAGGNGFALRAVAPDLAFHAESTFDGWTVGDIREVAGDLFAVGAGRRVLAWRAGGWHEESGPAGGDSRRDTLIGVREIGGRIVAFGRGFSGTREADGSWNWSDDRERAETISRWRTAVDVALPCGRRVLAPRDGGNSFRVVMCGRSLFRVSDSDYAAIPSPPFSRMGGVAATDGDVVLVTSGRPGTIFRLSGGTWLRESLPEAVQVTALYVHQEIALAMTRRSLWTRRCSSP
jgi:hypothetical protein